MGNNYSDLLHYSTWKEFENNVGEFPGQIPRIFEMIDDDMILKTKDISELLVISEETVRRWCRQHKLRIISPVGSYKVLGEDLKDFIYQWYRNDFLKKD
ncbi:helix-turn-helix domain-containing protein [Heyndrickxia sp. NPDC080065]|uniref:helix-turn-helix domain-containing protein n=1 Tax=Heyndrickxia sp. NPDC080065 TaxID=3390568 RepID=UPI003D0517F9